MKTTTADMKTTMIANTGFKIGGFENYCGVRGEETGLSPSGQHDWIWPMDSEEKKNNEKKPASAGGNTLVTLLLDRSGSMHSLRDDTIGAFNAYIDGLKEASGDIRLTFIQFDTDIGGSMHLNKVHVGKPIREVPHLDREGFFPRGGTPLIDAAFNTIKAIEESVRERRDIKVIVAIQTDGQENSSRENNWASLKSLISEKEKDGWEFIFMGVGIDAYDQGGRMGLHASKILSYGKDRAETMAAFSATAANTRAYSEGTITTMAYSDIQKMAAGDGAKSSKTEVM